MFIMHVCSTHVTKNDLVSMRTTAGEAAARLGARFCAQLCKALSEDCLLYLFYRRWVSTFWINRHNFSLLQNKLENSNVSHHPRPSPSDHIELRHAALLWMQSYPRSTRNVSLHTLGFRLGLNLWGEMVDIIWPLHSASADVSFRWLLCKCLVTVLHSQLTMFAQWGRLGKRD